MISYTFSKLEEEECLGIGDEKLRLNHGVHDE